MSSLHITPGTSSSILDYMVLQSLGERPEYLELPSRSSPSWEKFSHSSTHPSRFVADVAIIPTRNTTAAISDVLIDGYLTPEDRKAREKGLALVTRIEQLMQTEEGFRDWFQEGFDEIAAGHFATFSEEGYKEE